MLRRINLQMETLCQRTPLYGFCHYSYSRVPLLFNKNWGTQVTIRRVAYGWNALIQWGAAQWPKAIINDTAITTPVPCSLQHDTSHLGFGGQEPHSPSKDNTLVRNEDAKGLILEQSVVVQCYRELHVQHFFCLWITVELYKFPEVADMHLTYDDVGGSAGSAARHYAEMFPNRWRPNYKMFFRIIQRLRDSGCFVLNTTKCRCPQNGNVGLEE
jgi:hypothetical protein